MKRPSCNFFFIFLLLMGVSNGNAQPPLLAGLHNGRSTAVSAPASPGKSSGKASALYSGKNTASLRHAPGILTKYEQTCATRFFEFCDYLLTPPDIVIDSASYTAGEKREEVVMQRERAEDTARIKKAVLRYTVVPVPTDTSDSLHFSQQEMSDQAYRNLESAFTKLEKLLDTCYNVGGTPLKLVPFRLHNNAIIRSQLTAKQLSRTFLLQKGRQTLAVLVFTPRSRMTPTKPPRICGWSVDFRKGRMIFHNISAGSAGLAFNR